MEEMQKGKKETPLIVEIDSPSTPLDEPKSTLVEKALKLRYMLKSQDIIGIDDDKFKYSCCTNSMDNILNSMPCSNDDHIHMLEFLENHNDGMFMLEQINYMPKEPLAN
jgi:hypothetical protein